MKKTFNAAFNYQCHTVRVHEVVVVVVVLVLFVLFVTMAHGQ